VDQLIGKITAYGRGISRLYLKKAASSAEAAFFVE
jgi:hypothetical protein